MERKRSRRRSRTTWIDQNRKDIEMTRENWKGIQGNRGWENRDCWTFLCKKLTHIFRNVLGMLMTYKKGLGAIHKLRHRLGGGGRRSVTLCDKGGS